MADITEIVHTINYEVNDDALTTVTKAATKQIYHKYMMRRKCREHCKQSLVPTGC